MALVDWNEVATALGACVHDAGFEVLGAVNAGAYNRTLEAHLDGYRLPELGGENALVLVVGNTRRLWPLFLDAYASTPLRTEANPLDVYSRAHIEEAAHRAATRFGARHALRFSFDPAPNAVAIQRLATLSGIAEVSPTGLCVHPAFGPWFSLRAAVVFDVEGPAPRAATPTCSACTARPCLSAGGTSLRSSPDWVKSLTSRANWKAWLAPRDACPIGTTARYDDRQVTYHYTKDRAVLDDLIAVKCSDSEDLGPL